MTVATSHRGLRVANVSKRFGGLNALSAVNFDAESGSITALIGPNGAGKTTMFNVITGVLHPDQGQVYLDGEEIGTKSVEAIARMGVRRTFQLLQIVSDLTVMENVALGALQRTRFGILDGAFMTASRLRKEREMWNAAAYVLRRLRMEDLADRRAGDLPFGQQRMVEIARALVAQPCLLVLDEPAAGMSGPDRDRLADLLLDLAREGLSIILVEHDMDLVFRIADRVVVLNLGSLLAQGTPDEIRRSETVRRAYLE